MVVLTFVLMFCRISLLILPILGFVEMMSLYVGLFWKLGLWSLSVIGKLGFGAVMLILSSRSSCAAIVLSSIVMGFFLLLLLVLSCSLW